MVTGKKQITQNGFLKDLLSQHFIQASQCFISMIARVKAQSSACTDLPRVFLVLP